VAVGVLALAACGEGPPSAEPLVRPVKILRIDAAGQGRILEYPGEIRAAQNADIGFEVPGKLVEFPVTEGQRVQRGQVLAKLDPRDYQSELNAAVAHAGAMKAEYDRSRILFENQVASKQELERAQRNFEVAAAQEEKARKALEDTVLHALFDGTVARKRVDDYANVQAKQTVVTLQTGSALEIVVNMPEQDFARARIDVPIEEINRDLEVRVVLSSLPDRGFPARLKEFATVADPTTRTFAVTFSFDAPPDVNVSPGMTAKLIGRGPAAGNATIRIPVQAATESESGRPFVWLVDPASMTVRRAPVTLGPLTGGDVEVLSGLSTGDQVVTSGVHHLSDGMQVRGTGS